MRADFACSALWTTNKNILYGYKEHIVWIQIPGRGIMPPSSMSVVLLLVIINCIQVCYGRSIENRLISSLLANYSRHSRPIEDVGQPVRVSISFYLTQLMSLEEKHQILTTFGWLETYWQDDYLVWSPDDYDGLNQVVLSPELVWLPDFGVENSAKAIYEDVFFKRFRVSVTSTGRVNWVPGGKFVTSCQLDITFYPFDNQACHIDLVDWAYHGLQVQLVNGSDTIGLDAYTESGEWQIERTVALSSNQYYESDPGVPFPRVRFSLYLRRKPMFYTINIITPCMTMSLLALLVFYLPPDSGEKVSLGITVLLSFSVFLLLVAENVPKTSEFVPLLGIYLTLIMAMTAMSIVICVIVLNLHHRDPNRPVPPWLRHLAYDVMANIVCARDFRPPGQSKSTNTIQLQELHQQNSESHSETNDILLQNSNYSEDSSFGEHHGNVPSHREGVLLEEILDHLRQITGKVKENEEEDVLQAEWKAVAKILDRFFLLLFVLLVFISSLVLLYIYPLSSREMIE